MKTAKQILRRIYTRENILHKKWLNSVAKDQTPRIRIYGAIDELKELREWLKK